MRYKHSDFLLTLSILLLAACAQVPPASQQAYETMAGTDFEGVIVPADLGSDFGLSGDFWTPGEFDVLQMENWLEKYLADNGQPELAEKLENYNRQYIGLLKDGQKIIHANFFCDAGEVDWKSAPVLASEGNECYFQVDYDTQSGLFIQMQFKP